MFSFGVVRAIIYLVLRRSISGHALRSCKIRLGVLLDHQFRKPAGIAVQMHARIDSVI